VLKPQPKATLSSSGWRPFSSQSTWNGLAFARQGQSFARAYQKLGIAGLGLGTSLFLFGHDNEVYCEPVPKSAPTPPSHPADPLPPPPSSSVNFYELTFGTVCGICAGVFVKKSMRFAAFVLGGLFVILQYFSSLSMVRVDWGRMATRFENLFYTKDPHTGVSKPPNVASLFRWIIDFLTADFQQRASFVAGLALGLRVG